MNNYYDNNYNRPPQKPQNNTTLIAVLAILCTVVIAVFIVAALFMTGVINLSGDPGATGGTLPVATDTGENVQVQEPVETTMYVANVNYSIYFRSAPVENDSNIICEILYGTPVTHLGDVDAVFSKIRYNGQEGYAKREYLSTSVPPAKPAEPSAYDGDTSVKYTVYVANVENSIYLRSQPNESSDNNIITTIPLGTAVGYIEQTNGTFSKIKYGDKIGYSKSIYLSSRGSSSPSGYMTVSGVKTSIYLRRRPSSDEGSNIICEIPVGSRVEFISDAGNGYYKIRWNGTTGYGTAKYLR